MAEKLYSLDVIPPKGDLYWEEVRNLACELGSDGCTGVKDWYVDACFEHDIHWRTGKTLWEDTITTREANARFRRVIQSRSRFGRFSPLASWRWLGVTISGRFISHKSK